MGTRGTGWTDGRTSVCQDAQMNKGVDMWMVRETNRQTDIQVDTD